MPMKQSYSRPIALSTQEMKIVNCGLSQWGKLTRLEQGEHLNCPSQHYLDSFTKLDIRTMGARHCNWPHHLEQIDYLINQLGRKKPKWAKALIYYYTHAGSVRQQAVVNVVWQNRLSTSSYNMLKAGLASRCVNCINTNQYY